MGPILQHFEQHDFHVSFQIFLRNIPPYLQMNNYVVETNRCFFLHLGVAVGIHPFALQESFRIRTKQLLARDSTESHVKEIIGTVTQYAGLVDANSLVFLWPREFRNYRICLISGDVSQSIFSVFQSKVCLLSSKNKNLIFIFRT